MLLTIQQLNYIWEVFTMKKLNNAEFKCLFALVSAYDIYTKYIEDYNQEKDAERKNKALLNDIQKIAPIDYFDIWNIQTKQYEDWKKNLIKTLKRYEIEVEDKKEMKKEKEKRIWKEEEVIHHIKTNDKVLYNALLKLYDCQTADEQMEGNAKVNNGIGFNGFDAPILTSFAEFLLKTGFLTYKQKNLCRKKLVKYRRQLTLLANM